MKVMEHTRLPLLSSFKGDNSNRKQGRATILARGNCLDLIYHVHQILSKYLKGYKSYGVHKVSPLNYCQGTKQSKGKQLSKHMAHYLDRIYMYLKGYKSFEANKLLSEDGQMDASLMAIFPDLVHLGVKTRSRSPK